MELAKLEIQKALCSKVVDSHVKVHIQRVAQLTTYSTNFIANRSLEP